VIRKAAPTLCLLALLGSAAHAGTVYVPLPGNLTVGSATWEQVVFVSNGGAEQASFSELVLRGDTDGTVRPPAPTSQALPAKQGTGLALDAASQGLLELAGPGDLTFSARLERVNTDDSTELPIISSANAAAAGSTLYVQGLRRSATVATDWTFVNLGWTAANCKVSTFSVDGSQIGTTATITLKPLSSKVFADVLQIIGLSAAEYVRGTVSCDQQFYTFAMSRDTATGDVGLIPPSGRGNSTLTLGGDGGNNPGNGCPAGASCFGGRAASSSTA